MSNTINTTEPRTVLGLDVSTDTIGISLALVDDNGDIIPVEVTHLKLKVSKKKQYTISELLFVKNNMFAQKLAEYNEKYVIDKVVIEEPLISSNNAITVSTLLKFNGMVSLTVYNMLHIAPEYISSYDARKYGMPQLMAIRKYDKKGNEYPLNKIRKAIAKNELTLFGAYPFDIAKKDVIWGYISEKFPNISWVYNKKGELRKENFDASDSLICIMGSLNRSRYGESEPEIVCCDTREGDGSVTCTIDYTVSFCGQSISKRIELHNVNEQELNK